MKKPINPFVLLKKKTFGPFFWVQFFGAFNDNLYKNALIVLIVFQGVHWTSIDTTILVTLCTATFVLPFIIFSATAGQIADKFEKSKWIQFLKLVEFFISCLCILGFYLHNIWILMAALLLYGVQASFFGPVKYSILPQHLTQRELIAGNGMVEMGTFIAILLGTILGGILISVEPSGMLYVSIALFVFSVAGLLLSRLVPQAEANSPRLKINWNFITATKDNLLASRSNKMVFIANIGISWFWFYGATFLSLMPSFTKIMGGNNFVVSTFLAAFSVGAGIGSVLCEKFSHGEVKFGLVSVGAFGLGIFAIDLYFAIPVVSQSVSLGPWIFFQQLNHIRILLDLLFIGVSSGFFNVPLTALLQIRTPNTHRSRVIAANNIISSIFMVLSAAMIIVLLKLQLHIPTIFLVTAVLNFAVALYLKIKLK